MRALHKKAAYRTWANPTASTVAGFTFPRHAVHDLPRDIFYTSFVDVKQEDAECGVVGNQS
jgi:hypothetical protein